MGTLNEKLTYLLETKDQIQAAIQEKGGDCPDVCTFRDYANIIRGLSTGSSGGGGGSGDIGGGSGDIGGGGTAPILTSLTVTPTAEDQTFTPEEGCDGYDSVTVTGVEGLVAENIPLGTTIGGIIGTWEKPIDPDVVELYNDHIIIDGAVITLFGDEFSAEHTYGYNRYVSGIHVYQSGGGTTPIFSNNPGMYVGMVFINNRYWYTVEPTNAPDSGAPVVNSIYYENGLRYVNTSTPPESRTNKITWGMAYYSATNLLTITAEFVPLSNNVRIGSSMSSFNGGSGWTTNRGGYWSTYLESLASRIRRLYDIAPYVAEG